MSTLVFLIFPIPVCYVSIPLSAIVYYSSANSVRFFWSVSYLYSCFVSLCVLEPVSFMFSFSSFMCSRSPEKLCTYDSLLHISLRSARGLSRLGCTPALGAVTYVEAYRRCPFCKTFLVFLPDLVIYRPTIMSFLLPPSFNFCEGSSRSTP